MDQVRNEEVERRTGVVRKLAGSALCVEVVWTHGENVVDQLVKRIIGSDVRGVGFRGRP